jgi:poly(A) polymerase
MEHAVDPTSGGAIRFLEASFTALDRYRGIAAAPIRFLIFRGGLPELARLGYELEFVGLPYADAASPESPAVGEGPAFPTRYVCVEPDDEPEPHAYPLLDLTYDGLRRVFRHPHMRFPDPREPVLYPGEAPDELVLFETAVLLARYPYRLPEGGFRVGFPRDLSPAFQRDLLSLIVTGRDPCPALEWLAETGFLERYWPEIFALRGVNHAKEFHPEGDAWAHTLETFRYRKLTDLRLSLGLLLHDVGKSESHASEGRRFDRHSEIGARVARRFMERLEFPKSLVDDVEFLVLRHMMPAALPRLPMNRVQGDLENPLFPILLELYRCDELSTFRGPDGYYDACAAYRQYLKNVRNPYRSPDGRKTARAFLE